MKRFFCFLLLLLIGSADTFGQEPMPFEPRPIKALIVLLPYSSQRVKILKEQGDFATAEALTSDYAEMRARMISDFRDNYSYGTYYFLPDSQAYALRERANWDNLLLAPDLQRIEKAPIGPQDTAVLIAQYGLRARPRDVHEDINGAQEQYSADYRAWIYPSMILTDYTLQPFPYKMKRIKGIKYTPKPLRYPRWVYYYRSKRFQIAYNHAAAALSARIFQFFGPPAAN